MTKKLFSLVLALLIVAITQGQEVQSKKCKTCGKPLKECQYKGKHPEKQDNYKHPEKQANYYLKVDGLPKQYGSYIAPDFPPEGGSITLHITTNEEKWWVEDNNGFDVVQMGDSLKITLPPIEKGVAVAGGYIYLRANHIKRISIMIGQHCKGWYSN